MDNLSYPQPIKAGLHLCHRHRSHLFFIGTFLMGIGILVVLSHTNNGALVAAAAASSSSSLNRLPSESIQHEREKRQTNQNSYEELQREPWPLPPSLQHEQSTSDLTVITVAATRSTAPTISTRSPSFTSIGNSERWPSTKRGQNRKTKHQSIADGDAATHRHQSHRHRQYVENARSMSTTNDGTRNRQQKHDTAASNEMNKNRHRYKSIKKKIENNVSDGDDDDDGGGSDRRNQIPKINNNFSLRSNFTAHFKVHAYAGANGTIGVGDAKRPLPLSSQRQPPQFSNVKRKMYANASITTGRPSKNHLLVQGTDGYLVVRKYTCIMCKVIPGEPMRRPNQSLNNKQWNRGMCLCYPSSTNLYSASSIKLLLHSLTVSGYCVTLFSVYVGRFSWNLVWEPRSQSAVVAVMRIVCANTT